MRGRSPASYHWDSQWRWVPATTRRVGVLGSAQPSELVSVNAISPCPCRWLTRGAARPRRAGEPATADNPGEGGGDLNAGGQRGPGEPQRRGGIVCPCNEGGDIPQPGKREAVGTRESEATSARGNPHGHPLQPGKGYP